MQSTPMSCFCKVHFNSFFVYSFLQNDFFPPGVQSKSSTFSLRRVCHVPCATHRLAFEIWAIYFRIFSFGSYEEYGLFYSFLSSVNLLGGVVFNLLQRPGFASSKDAVFLLFRALGAVCGVKGTSRIACGFS
jgi:hypothetical protein